MVQLVKLTEAEYRVWLDRTVIEFAEEKVHAGNWKADEAIQRSEKVFHDLLPGGADTPGQELCSIVEESSGCSVGVLWYARQDGYPKPAAYIYDLLIYEPFRRQGYAEQAMLALETRVKSMGLDMISLHAFGHNRAARSLYEKLGYETTNVYMSKKLSIGETIHD